MRKKRRNILIIALFWGGTGLTNMNSSLTTYCYCNNDILIVSKPTSDSQARKYVVLVQSLQEGNKRIKRHPVWHNLFSFVSNVSATNDYFEEMHFEWTRNTFFTAEITKTYRSQMYRVHATCWNKGLWNRINVLIEYADTHELTSTTPQYLSSLQTSSPLKTPRL